MELHLYQLVHNLIKAPLPTFKLFATFTTLFFCISFLVHHDPKGQQNCFSPAYKRNLLAVICPDLDWIGRTRVMIKWGLSWLSFFRQRLD